MAGKIDISVITIGTEPEEAGLFEMLNRIPKFITISTIERSYTTFSLSLAKACQARERQCLFFTSGGPESRHAEAAAHGAIPMLIERAKLSEQEAIVRFFIKKNGIGESLILWDWSDCLEITKTIRERLLTHPDMFGTYGHVLVQDDSGRAVSALLSLIFRNMPFAFTVCAYLSHKPTSGFLDHYRKKIIKEAVDLGVQISGSNLHIIHDDYVLNEMSEPGDDPPHGLDLDRRYGLKAYRWAGRKLTGKVLLVAQR